MSLWSDRAPKGLFKCCHLHNRSFMLCMCVQAWIHICVHAGICMHTCTLRHTHTYLHTYTYTHTQACTWTHTHTFQRLAWSAWIIELSGDFLAIFSLTLIPMAWHMQIKEWVGDGNNTSGFERSSFQCSWILPPQLSSASGVHLSKAVTTKSEANPFPVGPECSGWFYYMEERQSIGISYSDSICILRMAEMLTCTKVAWFIYF